MAKQEEEGLAGFDWAGGEEDFFGVSSAGAAPDPEPSTVTPTEEELATAKAEEEKKAAEAAKKVADLEEEEDDFFAGVEAEKAKKAAELEDDDTPPPKATGQPENYYEDLYKDLKDTGIFKHVEFDPEEDEIIDAERLMELQEEEYNSEVSHRIETWANELDDDAKAFIRFKQDGGNTSDFFKAYKDVSSLPEGNLADEAYQDRVIRYSLTQEGWEAEDIEDRLAFLTDNGKKEKFATRYNDKIEKAKVLKTQEVEKQNKARIARNRANETEFREAISSTLESTKEVQGFKIKPKEKGVLLNLLTKRDHKLPDNRTITGFQKKLGEVFQDPEKMILLAKLVNSDFNMDDFKKNVITKKTRQVKSNLEQRRTMRPSKSGSTGGSSLADLF